MICHLAIRDWKLSQQLRKTSDRSSGLSPFRCVFGGCKNSSDTGKWYKLLWLTQAKNKWKIWNINLENNSQDKTIDIELLERSRKETDEEKYSKENSMAISFKCFETIPYPLPLSTPATQATKPGLVICSVILGFSSLPGFFSHFFPETPG